MKCNIYEKLLNSTNDTEQLKMEIKDKDNQINELNKKTLTIRREKLHVHRNITNIVLKLDF